MYSCGFRCLVKITELSYSVVSDCFFIEESTDSEETLQLTLLYQDYHARDRYGVNTMNFTPNDVCYCEIYSFNAVSRSASASLTSRAITFTIPSPSVVAK